MGLSNENRTEFLPAKLLEQWPWNGRQLASARFFGYCFFFTKNLSSPTVFVTSRCKWARLNLIIFRKISRAIFSISIFIREKMAPKVGTVAQIFFFLQFTFFSKIEFRISRCSALPNHPSNMPAKFHCDPASRLACRAWTDKIKAWD